IADRRLDRAGSVRTNRGGGLMSRSPSMDPRDDVRSPEPTVSRAPAEGRGARVPLDRLTLRPGREREAVRHRGRTYSLRESDVRTLATVGTFRVRSEEHTSELQ